MGDPGFGKWFKRAIKPPKALRKLKLGSLISPALSFLPGGGIVAAIAQRFGVHPSVASRIAQLAGYEGDAWMGDPGPPKKRKSAASGTKAKAKKKAERRASPKSSKPKKGSAGKSIDWGKIGEAATSLLPVGADLAKEIGKQAGAFGTDADLSGIAGGKIPRGLFGGHRRRMNPTNVKALRRGIRRIEGFEKIVKSIERAYPRLRRASGHAGARRGGHRSGCACAVCKRRAA
jgi:hypothetical protein